MSRDEEVPEAEFRVVALDERRAVSAYPEDVVERCRQIWSTLAGASAARTVRWYAAHSEPGSPVPTERTIRTWAKEHDWHERRRADFARYHGRNYEELQMMFYAGNVAGAGAILDIHAGMYDDNPAGGVLRLKAAELSMRATERGLVPLMPPAPAQESTDWDALSLEEQEALMRETLQKRKKAGHG